MDKEESIKNEHGDRNMNLGPWLSMIGFPCKLWVRNYWSLQEYDLLGLWQLWTRSVTFVETRSSVWCPAGSGKFDRFLHLESPQKAISVHSVHVLLGLVAWQLPFAFAAIIQPHSEFCTALPVLDHTNTGVVLVRCRCGGHSTTQVCGLTPAILAIPRIKSGSKPSFLSA